MVNLCYGAYTMKIFRISVLVIKFYEYPLADQTTLPKLMIALSYRYRLCIKFYQGLILQTRF